MYVKFFGPAIISSVENTEWTFFGQRSKCKLYLTSVAGTLNIYIQNEKKTKRKDKQYF